MKKSKRFDPFDLCACYEPFFEPPRELLKEWKSEYDKPPIEPTLENTSFYVTDFDGTQYLYCGNTRIKISEHFSDSGNTIDDLIADVVQFTAGTGSTRKNTPICA